MADQDLVFSALAEFTHTLVQRYAIADVLSHLTEQVPRALTIFGAGVSVGDEGGVLRFVTCSSDRLVEVERIQEAAQEGPCVDAFQSGEVQTTEDLQSETRWPEYRPVAVSGGFSAVAAIPLHAAGVAIGSLNLYATEAGPWADDTIRAACLFGDMASSYLANASELQRSERMREQLQEALNSRIIIEQAKGLIAGAQRVSVEVAYQRLRAYTRGAQRRTPRRGERNRQSRTSDRLTGLTYARRALDVARVQTKQLCPRPGFPFGRRSCRSSATSASHVDGGSAEIGSGLRRSYRGSSDSGESDHVIV